MEIFSKYNMPNIRLEWEVMRGHTLVREDFRHAEVWVFLTSRGCGMIPVATPLSVDITGNVIRCDIPNDLDPGDYGVKVIWVKDGTGSRSLNELLACNKRCMSEVSDVFGVSDSPYADVNPNGSVTLRVRSSVATYGYDGLSAYERAVMLGKTTDSEDNWLVTKSDIPELVSRVSEIESKIASIPSTEELNRMQEKVNEIYSGGASVSLTANPSVVLADGREKTITYTATSTPNEAIARFDNEETGYATPHSFIKILSSSQPAQISRSAVFEIEDIIVGTRSAIVKFVYPIKWGFLESYSEHQLDYLFKDDEGSAVAKDSPEGDFTIDVDATPKRLYFRVPKSQVSQIKNVSMVSGTFVNTIDGGIDQSKSNDDYSVWVSDNPINDPNTEESYEIVIRVSV